MKVTNRKQLLSLARAMIIVDGSRKQVWMLTILERETFHSRCGQHPRGVTKCAAVWLRDCSEPLEAVTTPSPQSVIKCISARYIFQTMLQVPRRPAASLAITGRSAMALRLISVQN